jgi:hypothetical protein
MHVKGVGLKFPDGTEQTTAAVGGSGPETGDSGVYTKEETDTLLATKANVGVSYTKEEADIIVDEKADIGVSYTKAETEARLATKADVADLSMAVPTGVITLWSGGVVPDGWALCDGTNGTPNLLDRFVVGAGSIYGADTTGGSADAIAISHSHTASTNNTGNHTHSVSGSAASAGSHTHSYTKQAGSTKVDTNGMAGAASYPISSAGGTTGSGGAHTHSISGTAASKGAHTHTVTVASAGSSGTGKNLPPYYALAYIMKIT